MEVISATQPYNTDQNIMNMSYYSTWSAGNEEYHFYPTFALSVDKPSVGSIVEIYMSVEMDDNRFDVYKCSVEYDGDANLPFVAYTAVDAHSDVLPYETEFGGVVTASDTNEWEIINNSSSSSCPALSKCVFTCAGKRRFYTGENQESYDKNFSDEGKKYIEFGYAIRAAGTTVVSSGRGREEEFEIPLFSSHLSTFTAVSLSSILALAYVF
mmetsp:Transcript_6591/g.4756  ORF Transcript_6591/g.4756 Transcript_6591/m.4756 type:complete len:212 (+) Transcript_6591:139-774(+)